MQSITNMSIFLFILMNLLIKLIAVAFSGCPSIWPLCIHLMDSRIMHPAAPCYKTQIISNWIWICIIYYILHKTVYFHTLYSILFAGCSMFPMTVPLSGSNYVINVKNKFNRKDKNSEFSLIFKINTYHWIL